MKLVFMTIVFLFSLPSAAQYKDLSPGEYYNDDMITDKPKPAPRADTPVQWAQPQVMPLKPIAKKPVVRRRKPASLFEEVKPSRHMGDFQDVTNGSAPRGTGAANQ